MKNLTVLFILIIATFASAQAEGPNKQPPIHSDYESETYYGSSYSTYESMPKLKTFEGALKEVEITFNQWSKEMEGKAFVTEKKWALGYRDKVILLVFYTEVKPMPFPPAPAPSVPSK